MTQSLTFVKSSAFYRQPLDVGSSFSTWATLNLSGPLPNNGDFADGIAIVFHTGTINEIGVVGQGIGYKGLKGAFAVEIDTFINYDEHDPPRKHIALTKPSTTNVGCTDHNECQLGINNFTVTDGVPFNLSVIYNHVTTNWKVGINNATVIDTNFNLTNTFPAGWANFGFTSSTGSWFETAKISSWYFKSESNTEACVVGVCKYCECNARALI